MSAVSFRNTVLWSWWTCRQADEGSKSYTCQCSWEHHNAMQVVIFDEFITLDAHQTLTVTLLWRRLEVWGVNQNAQLSMQPLGLDFWEEIWFAAETNTSFPKLDGIQHSSEFICMGELIYQKTPLSSTYHWFEAHWRFRITVRGVAAAVSLFGDDLYSICFDHPNRETAMLSILLLLLSTTSPFPSLSMVSLCPPPTGNMIKVICFSLVIWFLWKRETGVASTSDQMFHRSQVSRVALWWCSLNVIVFVVLAPERYIFDLERNGNRSFCLRQYYK